MRTIQPKGKYFFSYFLHYQQSGWKTLRTFPSKCPITLRTASARVLRKTTFAEQILFFSGLWEQKRSSSSPSSRLDEVENEDMLKMRIQQPTSESWKRYQRLFSETKLNFTEREELERRDGEQWRRRRQSLRSILREFVSWASDSSNNKPLGLAHAASELAFDESWFKTSCEVFFSCLPESSLKKKSREIEEKLMHLSPSLDKERMPHQTMHQSDKEHAEGELALKEWIQGSVSFNIPFSVVLSAVHQVSSNGDLGTDSGEPLSDKKGWYTSSSSFVCAILSIVDMLTTMHSEGSLSSNVDTLSVKKKAKSFIGLGQVISLQLYFACIWELLAQEKQTVCPLSSLAVKEWKTKLYHSSTDNSIVRKSRNTTEVLRYVAKESARYFGISMNIKEEEEEMIDTSLRLLRYRWLSLMEQSGRPAHTPPFPLFSRQDSLRFHDAMVTVCVQLWRVYLAQQTKKSEKSFTVSVAKSSLDESLSPQVIQFLLQGLCTARRWDVGEYVSLLADQYWCQHCSASTEASERTQEYGKALNIGSTASALTVDEEDVLLQQLRFFLLSRQWKRGLQWWSWITSSSLCELSYQRMAFSLAKHKEELSKPASSISSLYPLPSISVLTVLARIICEFCSKADYYLSQKPASHQRLQFSSRQSSLRHSSGFPEPRMLSMWCLEMMLHNDQPHYPSGDALFLGVLACAKSGLAEFENILDYMVENNVLVLTPEEIFHAKLIHYRRHIHWKEKIENLFPPLRALYSVLDGTEEIQRNIELNSKKPLVQDDSDLRQVFLKLYMVTETEKNNLIVADPSSEEPTDSIDLFRDFTGSKGKLSERNIYLILLILQEGNDQRFLPFFVLMLERYKEVSQLQLSIEQRCRWIILALSYTAANAQNLPKEWIWKVALEALAQLHHDSAVDCPTGFSGLLSLEEDDSDLSSEFGEAQQNAESKSGGNFLQLFDSQEFILSAQQIKQMNRDSPGKQHITSGITHETWLSLQTKWEALHNQFPASYWQHFHGEPAKGRDMMSRCETNSGQYRFIFPCSIRVKLPQQKYSVELCQTAKPDCGQRSKVIRFLSAESTRKKKGAQGRIVSFSTVFPQKNFFQRIKSGSASLYSETSATGRVGHFRPQASSDSYVLFRK